MPRAKEAPRPAGPHCRTAHFATDEIERSHPAALAEGKPALVRGAEAGLFEGVNNLIFIGRGTPDQRLSNDQVERPPNAAG